MSEDTDADGQDPSESGAAPGSGADSGTPSGAPSGAHSEAAPSRRLIALGLVAALGLGGAAYGISTLLNDRDEVTVHALWVGRTAEGKAVSGVTPVKIEAITDDGAPVLLDLNGEVKAGAGPVWKAATAVAGLQAVLASGADPRTGQLKYSLDEAIDGPSAGALMAAGSLAAIESQDLSDSITMTGTVLPDGSVGPVGGVPDKIRAAAEAGFKEVLIPTSQQSVVDERTGELESMTELGKSLGVTITPVASFEQAHRILTGQQPLQGRPGAADPVDSRVSALLAKTAADLNLTTAATLAALTRGEPLADATAKADAARVGPLLKGSAQSLAKGDAVSGFAQAAEAALAVRQWAAAADLQTRAKTTPVSRLAAQISQEAQTRAEAIRKQVRATAEIPLAKVEQLPALADALNWGIFAPMSIAVAQANLKKVSSVDELYAIVRFIETGVFEAETYMPTSAAAVEFVGKVALDDLGPTLGLFDAYADMLDDAADANVDYARIVGGQGSGSYLNQLIKENDGLTDSVSEQYPDLSGPTAESALRMSAALLGYVETAWLADDITESAGPVTSPNLDRIIDPSVIDDQTSVANGIAADEIDSITAAGLDPSYAAWNRAWGAEVAFGRLPQSAGEQVLHGLQAQWFTVLQTRLLMALANGRSAG